MPPVVQVRHPLVQHHLAQLRERSTPPAEFRLIIASRAVDAVSRAFPEAHVHVCVVDRELNARKFIVPGLGDAGDRTFNTLRGED
jgi:uracil phosphoribosyltransferase